MPRAERSAQLGGEAVKQSGREGVEGDGIRACPGRRGDGAVVVLGAAGLVERRLDHLRVAVGLLGDPVQEGPVPVCLVARSLTWVPSSDFMSATIWPPPVFPA